MDSGLYVQVLSSGEVIAAALFLILLLPLVFYIASTKSRRKIVRPPARRSRARPARKPVPAPKPADADESPDEADDSR